MPLKTETNTDDMETRITEAFACSAEAEHLDLDADTGADWFHAVFEHGQWWISASTGEQWSVIDATGPGAVDGFAFERVSEGDL